ncbi:hypothetical protein D5366_07370 [Neokomagataea tanensis]|uniref:Uncharacterized protein n=1 Tax=Neokomagataea tanensis TaxID=661191 RepID=A0A4Y6V4S7_9PROT|nr:hypothetical protein D5366_07370 [Neokomagataea tanensis]
MWAGGASKAWASAGEARFKIEEVAGHRPIAVAVMNGVPLKMMVHSNAALFLQVGHGLASRIGVENMHHHGQYGIAAVGRLSNLGRDEGTIKSLKVGSSNMENVPASVFETPTAATYGMLGLGWINRSRLVIDYRNNKLFIEPTPQTITTLKQELVKEGYAAIPMQETLGKPFTVDVTIGEATRAMVVSTVAELIIDSAFAEAAHVGAGDKVGTFGGPKGATGGVYSTAAPVELRIGSWRSGPTANGTLEDTYTYSGETRPVDPRQALGGALGGDFMIKHRAVIDFGNDLLYLKK